MHVIGIGHIAATHLQPGAVGEQQLVVREVREMVPVTQLVGAQFSVNRQGVGEYFLHRRELLSINRRYEEKLGACLQPLKGRAGARLPVKLADFLEVLLVLLGSAGSPGMQRRRVQLLRVLHCHGHDIGPPGIKRRQKKPRRAGVEIRNISRGRRCAIDGFAGEQLIDAREFVFGAVRFCRGRRRRRLLGPAAHRHVHRVPHDVLCWAAVKPDLDFPLALAFEQRVEVEPAVVGEVIDQQPHLDAALCRRYQSF